MLTPKELRATDLQQESEVRVRSPLSSRDEAPDRSRRRGDCSVRTGMIRQITPDASRAAVIQKGLSAAMRNAGEFEMLARQLKSFCLALRTSRATERAALKRMKLLEWGWFLLAPR